MTFVPKPTAHHPLLKTNEIGLTRRDYEAIVSTLCAGCGHDSVSAAVMQACHELSIPPHKFAKVSGIGCSSKTPSYFLGNAHGFNSVHGRMPSIATGAYLANKGLKYIGVSGDGDSASIGLGQFAHIIRRKVDMCYIVDNNGTYGLTKGQFSATNDRGSTSKRGVPNLYAPIDLVSLAIQLGASFVARSFSGDKQQLVPLIKAAILHKGFAFIDVISPCVMFNNHAGSTKSYSHVRNNTEPVVDANLIMPRDEISVEYEEGDTITVPMHDGSKLHLRKLTDSYEPNNRVAALTYVQKSQEEGEIVTGLLFLEEDAVDCHEILGTSDTPFSRLDEHILCPGAEVLEQINDSFR